MLGPHGRQKIQMLFQAKTIITDFLAQRDGITQSTLTATVPAGGSSSIDFALTSEP